MSWGEGEYYEEWWERSPDPKFFCANCGTKIYYPYKWRNIVKSKILTEDCLKIIKSKIYVQTNDSGEHIRLCDCCSKLFTTQQLIKLFLINGMGGKGREKEKLKKWNKIGEKKRQEVVKKFGRKIKIYELCLDCGGEGMIEPLPGHFRKECKNPKCFNGKIIKLISLKELISKSKDS